jgi:glycosyltransferase involved in cell wall biosynthesis
MTTNGITFVPAYNETNAIRSTIESLLSQTHNFGVIAINDDRIDNMIIS